MAPNHNNKMVYNLGEAKNKAHQIQGSKERSELLAQRDRLNLRLQSSERKKYDSRRRLRWQSEYASAMTLECQELTLLQIDLDNKLRSIERDIMTKYNQYNETKKQLLKARNGRKYSD